jgi:N-acyl-D-amino-acid deacylase
MVLRLFFERSPTIAAQPDELRILPVQEPTHRRARRINLMTTQRKGLTRRAALASLAGIGGLAATFKTSAQGLPPTPSLDNLPIKGKAGPGLERLEEAILDVMDRHGIPGAAFALAREGRLLFAKGYGWANVTNGTQADPETLFALASLSKPITAVATLKLVEQGKLELDDAVFDILKDVQAPRGARVDPLLKEITVRHCLNHSGGWDRTVKGDRANWEPQICRAFSVRAPLTSSQFLEFVVGRPLDFKPGTQQKYSNVGYVILGDIITKVSGQPYLRYVS